MSERPPRQGMTGAMDLSAVTRRMPQSGIREIFAMTDGYDTLYNLGIGDPDLATPEPIAGAVRDALGGGASGYTQTVGRADLRASLSEKLADSNGIDANPDAEVLVTPGAMGALYTGVQVLCDPGDEVLVPAPYWPNYAGHVASAGADLVAVPTDPASEFVPRVEDITDAVTGDTVGMVLNTPTNPTGTVVPPGTLREIGECLRERGLWCLLDETYEDLVYDGATHHSLASDDGLFERCLTIHSFSKSYAMTGWRVGYASGPADVISAMRVLQEHTVSCVAEPSQVAAMAALDHPEVVDDVHATFASRRRHVLDCLNAIDGVDPRSPSGAFYVFADVSAVADSSRELVESMLESVQVAAVPGSVFGDAGEGFVRFSYATDRGTIDSAMDRIERFVGQRG